MIEAYFMLSGRIRRLRFFFYSILLVPLLVLFVLVMIPAIDNARYPALASVFVVGAVSLIWIWAGAALVVKRLHDLNHSGWHYVWMLLLPGLLSGGSTLNFSGSFEAQWSVGFGVSAGVISILAMLYLLLARGSDGPNRYGYPP